MPLDKDFNYKATAKRFTPIGVLFFKLCPFEVAPKICFNYHFLIPEKKENARGDPVKLARGPGGSTRQRSGTPAWI